MRHTFIFTIALLIGVGICRPVFASDGRLLLSSSSSGGGLVVSVRVEPSEPINAIEATLRFDPRVLEVISVNDAGSPITLWIQRPIVTMPGVLSFAGAVPGGLGASGTPQATLYAVLFRVLKTSVTDIGLQDIQAYLNQPDAQPAVLTTSPIRISVTAADADVASLLRNDAIQPQQFTPKVFKGSTTDGVRRFVAFATTDKESGILKYEIRERRFGFGGAWLPAESPALLRDQWGTSVIEVRATDNAGNVRVARSIPFVLWLAWLIVLILIAGLNLMVFRARKLRTLS